MKAIQQRSFVLIDVVPGLALLASAGAALLVAQGRGLVLLRDAREMRQAGDLAEQLVTEWTLASPGETIAAEGRFMAEPTWRWTRRVLALPGDAKLPLQEVTMELWRRSDAAERLVHRLVWWERQHVAAR